MALTLAGSHQFDAPPQAVWEMIFTPDTMKDLIPGCHRLELRGEGIYQGEIMVGIASVGGTYETEVVVDEQVAPISADLSGEITGPTGTIKGTAHFSLKEVDDTTHFEYTAQAMISGALANMNERFVRGVAQTLIQQGLKRLDQQLAAAENPA